MKSLKKQKNDVTSVASIVLAGGQGTRLQPLTTKRCKPAVSFGGRFRLIDIPISNSLNSKIHKIFIISQYLAQSLKHHIDDTYADHSFHQGDLEILSPQEKVHGANWFKGTADAIRKNWEHLSQTDVDYFLILSGDQLYNIDFSKMLEFAKKTNADLVIASLPVEEAEAQRMGLLQVSKDRLVKGFVEKPSDPKVLKKFKLKENVFHPYKDHKHTPFYLGSMGIYIFKKETLNKLLKVNGDDFGHDLIPHQVKNGNTFAFIYDGYWEDIGTIGAFYKANLALTEDKEYRLDICDQNNPIYSKSSQLPDAIVTGTSISSSIVGPGSIIEAKKIQHSVIGASSRIRSGTVIKDSVILGNHYYPENFSKEKPLSTYFSIGENCIIEKAIIDEHTHIGNNVRLVNQNNLLKYDGDGIYIRDGIIVVTSGAVIPDGFTL
ncbi:MAG: glucose-1-phosphate adenylyltransferase [Chlamydiae bacterium]|nr:glucose-1-phosphate adenylyltransferase [Chlamydiota bacterium]